MTLKNNICNSLTIVFSHLVEEFELHEPEAELDGHRATIEQFVDLYRAILLPDRHRGKHELVAVEVDVTAVTLHRHANEVQL